MVGQRELEVSAQIIRPIFNVFKSQEGEREHLQKS